MKNKLRKLENAKQLLLKKVKKLTDEKIKLYSNMDISKPKSEHEKNLDKRISKIFSDINMLVKKKRDLK